MTSEKFLHDLIAAPAYQFTLEFIIKSYDEFRDPNVLEIVQDIIESLDVDVNKTLRIVEVDDSLMELVKATDNKIFHRPLFFPTVFINNNINFKDIYFKGILIQETIRTNGHTNIFGDAYEKMHKLANDYMIYTFTIDPIEQVGRLLSLRLISDEEEDDKFLRSQTSDIEKIKRHKEIYRFLRLVIVNIVDMVEGNDKDLNITTIETSKDQNIKRLNRNQIPFPTKVYIRPNAEFKKYIQRFNADVQASQEDIERKRISHKFLVRGHWRHFRAERFKKRGEIWIKPFWKGEGIAIAKEYKVIG